MIETQNNIVSIEYNARLPGFINGNTRYVASIDGKIRTASVCCPNCASCNYVNNGYHAIKDSLVQSLGLNIKISQFECKRCGFRWSTQRELIDRIIAKEKEFVKSVMIGAARMGLSFERSCTLAQDTMSVGYSPQHLYELYVSALDQVKIERAASASGVYYYDEQFLRENGKEVCRLTIRDQVSGQILLDKRDVDAQENTIKRAMHEALDGLPVEAFTIDMATRYPSIIAELYPNAQIQWCIFHLDKLIWKEVTEEFSKNPPLHQLYNAYLLFNIFFDHTRELEKLKELLTQLKNQRTNNDKKHKEVEDGLREEFRKFVKAHKKQRRRNKTNAPRRTIQESKDIFEAIKHEAVLFPKSLQKRIRRIEGNWDRFTLFQRDARVHPTNNGMEQYFAATLSKTDKKNFRSTNAVIRELRACQAEWNGTKLFPTTSLSELLTLVGLLFLAFPT